MTRPRVVDRIREEEWSVGLRNREGCATKAEKVLAGGKIFSTHSQSRSRKCEEGMESGLIVHREHGGRVAFVKKSSPGNLGAELLWTTKASIKDVSTFQIQAITCSCSGSGASHLRRMIAGVKAQIQLLGDYVVAAMSSLLSLLQFRFIEFTVIMELLACLARSVRRHRNSGGSWVMTLRLTGSGPTQPDNTDALQQVGWKLAQLAETIGVKFEFQGFVANSLADLDDEILDLRSSIETEVVVVNSVFELHRLLARPGAVEKVLNSVKQS
nr:DELLA protein RGA2-like [Nicotiana tomentosiformis]